MNWVLIVAIILSVLLTIIAYRYDDDWGASVLVLSIMICACILCYPPLKKSFLKFCDESEKRETIEVLATHENYDIFLDGEKISLDDIMELEDDSENILMKDVTIDSQNKAIYYFSDTEKQVKALVEYEDYSLMCNGEYIKLNDIIDYSDYNIFIDYENKKILLSK